MPHYSPQHHMKCQVAVGGGGGVYYFSSFLFLSSECAFFLFSFDVYTRVCVRTQVSSIRTKLVLDLCKGEGEGAGGAGGGV